MDALYHNYQLQEETTNHSTIGWVFKNWFQLLCLGLVLHLLFSRDISIQFNLHSIDGVAQKAAYQFTPTPTPQPQSMIVPTKYESEKRTTEKSKKDNKANNFSNLTFILSPDYAKQKKIDPEIVREKKQHVLNYVHHFSSVAMEEMAQYGIPASITLAQGLLESNAGDSRLSMESNNHFGIKCRSKCRDCTCRNYTDDDIYDMFRVFDSSLESFREHSKLLTSKRYSHLLKLKKTDYKKWAHGLKKAGYATDKHYADKLIKIIETLNLQKYDHL